MKKMFFNAWEKNISNYRELIITSILCALLIVISLFIDGFIIGLGAIVLLTILFVYCAKTFNESKYYIVAFTIGIIFIYDLLVQVNNNSSIWIMIGLIVIYLSIMLYSGIVLVSLIINHSKNQNKKGIIIPIHFVAISFYSILCAALTDVHISSGVFEYKTSSYFPLALFGLFLIQIGFIVYTRYFHVKTL